MVFLNPAVLFGLLAASIPVVIHLLNLRKLKKVEFSTLSFLKELQKTKIKRVKIKQWILLALRVALILFLVAAFARPTIESVSLGGSASAAKTTAVIILDDSFSMSALDENGSFFNQARQSMKTLLNEFQEGDEVAVITTSAENNLEPTSNFAQVVSFTDDLDVSNISGSLNGSLIQAAQIISESENFNKEIYILSDLQSSTLYENEASLTEFGQLLNEQVNLYLMNYAKDDLYNLAITDFKINNQIFEKNKPVSFSAAIANQSEENIKNSVASLFINGSRSAQQSVSLNPGETVTVNFETTLKDAGLLEVMSELEDDDILQDNRRFLSVLVPEKIKILLLSDNPDDSKFIDLALNTNRNNGSIEITKRRLNQISSFNLLNFNAVIIIGGNSISSYNRLKEYLANGGGLIYFPGDKTSLEKIREFCTELELPQPSGFIGKMNDDSNPINFDKIDFQHPLFENLFEKDENLEVESPGIYYHLSFFAGNNGRSIIELLDNSSFLSEFNYGEGKILFFNTPPKLSSTDLPVKALFPPLVNKSVFYLTSNVQGSKSITAGENLNVNLAGSNLPQIKILKPSGREEFISTDSLRNKTFFSYVKTNELGIYKIYSGEKLLDFGSINPEEKESLIKEGFPKFEKYLTDVKFGGQFMQLDPNDNFTEKIYQARFGSELWRYFVLVALLLAIIEMAVARNAKKELTEINQQ